MLVSTKLPSSQAILPRFVLWVRLSRQGCSHTFYRSSFWEFLSLPCPTLFPTTILSLNVRHVFAHLNSLRFTQMLTYNVEWMNTNRLFLKFRSRGSLVCLSRRSYSADNSPNVDEPVLEQIRDLRHHSYPSFIPSIMVSQFLVDYQHVEKNATLQDVPVSTRIELVLSTCYPLGLCLWSSATETSSLEPFLPSHQARQGECTNQGAL